jgi:hypothetical protein
MELPRRVTVNDDAPQRHSGIQLAHLPAYQLTGCDLCIVGE